MNTRTILAILAVLGLLLASCGPTPKGWGRDDSAVTQCTEMGEKAPAKACEYCCNQANAAGHVWKKDIGCECL